jgi:hypothetical protein
MDDDALENFCIEHLTKIKVEGFDIDWDFPGYLSLTPTEGAPTGADGGPLTLIVTPDFMNGRPDLIVVEIDMDGSVRTLAVEAAIWTGVVSLDETTWRNVVEKFRPALMRAVELARAGTDPTKEGVDLGIPSLV